MFFNVSKMSKAKRRRIQVSETSKLTTTTYTTLIKAYLKENNLVFLYTIVLNYYPVFLLTLESAKYSPITNITTIHPLGRVFGNLGFDSGKYAITLKCNITNGSFLFGLSWNFNMIKNECSRSTNMGCITSIKYQNQTLTAVNIYHKEETKFIIPIFHKYENGLQYKWIIDCDKHEMLFFINNHSLHAIYECEDVWVINGGPSIFTLTKHMPYFPIIAVTGNESIDFKVSIQEISNESLSFDEN